ncbi:MAG: hypothetical protein ACOCV1_06320 [Bacillota bacterium]
MKKNLKGKIGTSLNGSFIRTKNIKFKNSVLCKDCNHFSFNYYCSKKKKSVEYKDRYRECKTFKKKRDLEVTLKTFKEIVGDSRSYLRRDIDKVDWTILFINTSCSECKNFNVDFQSEQLFCNRYAQVITSINRAEKKKIKVPNWCKNNFEKR